MKKDSFDRADSLEKALRMIVGKWKTIVLWHLSSGKKRYGELRRLMPEITEKMLIQSLRELADHNLIVRKAYSEIPPRVEYTLTKKGMGLSPILCALDTWSRKHL